MNSEQKSLAERANTCKIIYLVALLFLINFPSFGQEIKRYKTDTTIYKLDTNTVSKLSIIQGKWCTEEDTITIKDNFWTVSNNLGVKVYEVQIKPVVEAGETTPFELLYLCMECRSFSEEESIPDGEILIYKIISVNKKEIILEDFLLNEIITLNSCSW